MPLRELPKAQWQAFLDQASKALGAQRVTVEVTGLALGDQIAADQVGLLGMSYEPRGDTLTVFLEGLEHRIAHPRSIHVDHDLEMLHSLEAVDSNGDRHIIQLREPLALPAP
jgi:hypothetical protein